MDKLLSLKHPLILHWINLRKEKSAREKTQKTLILGEKLIREFPGKIFSIISQNPTNIQAEKQYLANSQILTKIAGIDYSGWIAEVALPKEQQFSKQNYTLILDRIQDPGNFGTLIRTACALNWDGVIATPGSVDFFNDKVIRSSAGAVFQLPFCWKSPEEILSWIEKEQIHLFVADAKGTSFVKHILTPPIALLLSHEGQGVQNWAKSKGKSISIPIKNIDSLNVSAAGAILLQYLRGLS